MQPKFFLQIAVKTASRGPLYLEYVLNEESNATLIDAKKYVLLKKLDERIYIELISAFTKIYNLDQAKELLNLMKPGYEKAQAMALIGKELVGKKKISEISD